MPSQVPRSRLRDDAVNYIPARSMGKVARYSGGGHGAGAVIAMDEIPIIPAEQMAAMEQEQIMAGTQEFAGERGTNGFSSYFREKAAGTQLPADMMEALADADMPEFSQQEGTPEERDEDHDLDSGKQGPSPSSGHEPVAAGRFSFKQKVYIASLDVLGSVYEDNGSMVTVKTVHGKWLELSKRDVQAINTADVSSDGEASLSPRKVNQDNRNNVLKDQDSDSMSAFSRKQEGDYASRRRARRSET